MTQIVIDIGATANDGTGDPLRTAFNDVNLNFSNVFAAGPVDSNVRISNNKILTTNTNGNLVLAPNGIGVVQSNVSIVPNTSNIRNLGADDRRWSTIYAQYLDINQINLANNLSISGTLTVNQITSDDSSFVTSDEGLNVDGDVTATNFISSGVGTIRFSGITTVQRDTLTAVNGDMIYNSSLNKFQGYANGAWGNITLT